MQLIAELLQTRAELGETQMIVTPHSPLLVDQIPRTLLYVCRKDETGTQIEPFKPFPLWREQEASRAIDDDEEPLSVSAQILRGDLDA